MFGIELTLLTGRYAAQAYDDRNRGEWPPHPARLFSALVATWAETEDRPDRLRDALRFLETCGPPSIAADGPTETRVVPHFVPVNDLSVVAEPSTALARLEEAEATLAAAVGTAKEPAARAGLAKAQAAHDKRCAEVIASGKSSAEAIDTASKVLPERRVRQPRTFPSVCPSDPRVTFVFAEEDGSHSVGLAELCERLVRVGHSASLVSARRVVSWPEPRWRPDEAGSQILRWVAPGQFDRLEAAFARHQGVEPRVLPFRFVSYAHGPAATEAAEIGSVFGDDAVVLVVQPHSARRSLPITAAADVGTAVRGALLRHADQPAPPVISGHAPGGAPLDVPHLACIPLPDIGHAHADGHLLGVALVLPRTTSDEDRRRVYRAVSRWVRPDAGAQLVLGAAGAWTVRVDEEGDRRLGLQMRTWSAASRVWASATPVALDRNPGDLLGDGDKQPAAHREAEEIVATACEHVGLPRPEHVEVSFRPPWIGSAKVDRHHPPFPRKEGRIRRVQVHVRVQFPVPVSGPIAIGAGRYVGLGLLRPLREDS